MRQSDNTPLEYDSEGCLRMNSYNKGYGLNFPIVNFPFICSNIPIATAYGIYIYIYKLKVKINDRTILVSFFLKTLCYILEDESGVEILLVM
jgi:hypothetical protein